MSRQAQLFKLARSGLILLIHWILSLEKVIRDLRCQIKELQGRLALNSGNSGKPPSTDGLAKPVPKSLRSRSGRKPGGQLGHPGHTLEPLAEPDFFLVHALDRCPCGKCAGRSLQREPVLDYAKRQVFELPAKLLEVTEHRAEIKRCPVSGQLVKASFPEEVNAPAQYGPRFKSTMTYLNQQHLVPLGRLTQISKELFGQPLGEATVVSANERIAKNLEPFEDALKVLLPEEPLLNLDESGLRVNKKLHWLHVISSSRLTWYGVHPKRGREAMNFFGIIPRCKGWVIHDHFKPYFTYKDCLHALCNEHHLRELKFLFEEQGELWAEELSQFLLACNERRKAKGVLLEKGFKAALEAYHAILTKGRQRHPGQSKGKQSKAANLLDRLENYDQSVLAFVWEQKVAFTNNGGERDIRMIKSRQKVSGCFRTLEGARVFARIRSYTSTCRKQNQNILEALLDAYRGKPFIPTPLAQGP